MSRTLKFIAVTLWVSLSGIAAPTASAYIGGVFSPDESRQSTLRVAHVTLTNSEIKNLRATPITIIAAQGAGTAINPEFITLKLNAGSNVLTEAGYNLRVRWANGSTGPLVTSPTPIEMTGFIDQASDTYAHKIAEPAAASAATDIENQPVLLVNVGAAEFGGNAANDATMEVWITYTVLTL